MLEHLEEHLHSIGSCPSGILTYTNLTMVSSLFDANNETENIISEGKLDTEDGHETTVQDGDKQGQLQLDQENSALEDVFISSMDNPFSSFAFAFYLIPDGMMDKPEQTIRDFLQPIKTS